MIDIKFLRENPDVVKENIKKKYQDEKIKLVDEVIELDLESRKTQQEADDLRANRNKISKEIGALMAQGRKEEPRRRRCLHTERSALPGGAGGAQGRLPCLHRKADGDESGGVPADVRRRQEGQEVARSRLPIPPSSLD